MTKPPEEVVIVGAGPAGLSVAWALKRRGITPRVIEKTAAVGDVWRNHYEGLTLNTGRRFSRLAGDPIPASAGRWPKRDDMVALLSSYPARGGFSVETGVEVTTVTQDEATGLWEIACIGQDPIRARIVILAVGMSRLPVVPQWPGLETFQGEVVHSSKFRRASDYAGKSVLVVGSGNSGAEIASRLTEYANVAISVRTPPHILPRSVLGVPLAAIGAATRKLPASWVDRLLHWLQRIYVGDLGEYGLPRAQAGVSRKFAESHVTPTLYPRFAEDLRRGRLRVVGAVDSFTPDSVIVEARAGSAGEGKTSLQPDVIVAATGFRSGLADIVKVPGKQLPADWPQSAKPPCEDALTNLHIIGQTNPLSGQLNEIRIESERIASAISSGLLLQTAEKPQPDGQADIPATTIALNQRSFLARSH